MKREYRAGINRLRISWSLVGLAAAQVAMSGIVWASAEPQRLSFVTQDTCSVSGHTITNTVYAQGDRARVQVQDRKGARTMLIDFAKHTITTLDSNSRTYSTARGVSCPTFKALIQELTQAGDSQAFIGPKGHKGTLFTYGTIETKVISASKNATFSDALLAIPGVFKEVPSPAAAAATPRARAKKSKRSKPRTVADVIAGTWVGHTEVTAGKLTKGKYNQEKYLKHKCTFTFDRKLALTRGSAMGWTLVEGAVSKFQPRSRKVTIITRYALGKRKWKIRFEGRIDPTFTRIDGTFSNVMGRGRFTLVKEAKSPAPMAGPRKGRKKRS